MNLCIDCEFNQSTTSCEFNFVQGEEITPPLSFVLKNAWTVCHFLTHTFLCSSMLKWIRSEDFIPILCGCVYCVLLFSLLFWLCAFFVIVSLRFSKHFLITHLNCWIHSFSGLCALPLAHVCFLLKPFVLLGCTIGIMRFPPKIHITQSYSPPISLLFFPFFFVLRQDFIKCCNTLTIPFFLQCDINLFLQQLLQVLESFGMIETVWKIIFVTGNQ